MLSSIELSDWKICCCHCRIDASREPTQKVSPSRALHGRSGEEWVVTPPPGSCFDFLKSQSCCLFVSTRAIAAKRKRSLPPRAQWSTPWMTSGRWFGRKTAQWLLWSPNLKKKMRYALQPSSEYQRSAITIEETLCKKNHHALRTDLF